MWQFTIEATTELYSAACMHACILRHKISNHDVYYNVAMESVCIYFL